MAFNWKDNPLKDVKVKTGEVYDTSLLMHKILNGTDEGYVKRGQLESMKARQKRENQRNDF